MDVKNKENGKGKEVEEQGTENEEEQVAEKVKESSSTSIKILYPPPPVRDLGPASPLRRWWPFRPAGLCYVAPEVRREPDLVRGRLSMDGGGVGVCVLRFERIPRPQLHPFRHPQVLPVIVYCGETKDLNWS